MGLIERLFGLVFGSGQNIVKDTVEIFRPNAEAQDQRGAEAQSAALAQMAAEFAHPRRTRFDAFVDGLNRLPRPALAFGTLGLFVAAMVSPAWFAARMQGVALIPEPLWWLLGAIVSFYFGARHQVKGQEFQRSIARTLLAAPQPQQIRPPSQIGQADPSPDAKTTLRAIEPSGNAALDDWRRSRAS